jgi:hypothetical protein
MAAGNFRRLRLHLSGEELLGLGRDHLVLCADHIERWLVAPSGRIDRCFERRVIQGKLMACEGFGDLRRKVRRDRRRRRLGIDVEVASSSG